MTKLHLVAVLAALLVGAPASAQSAADLLQKGIHAQETVGDVDSAIQIFRQVAALPGANKVLAAQAQYQLVVCMLQKGDRGAARKELDLLARNFPDQPDLLSKARKLVPGGDTLVPAPWGEREGSQLNIRRDGVFTGEYFYYSVDPPPSNTGRPANPQAVILRWELQSANTLRSVQVEVDRDSLRALGKPVLHSNDYLGDPAVSPLAGPATDIEQSVFLMRRMPLAPGFKTTLNTQPLMLASKVKGPVEMSVTGIEAVQTVAGKFNCYKVAMPEIGQTFWFGVEGARPLVKIQAGKVEAELVKVWTGNALDAILATTRAGGWDNSVGGNRGYDAIMGPGPEGGTTITRTDSPNVSLSVRNVYTPKAEIAKALQQTMASRTGKQSVRPESVEAFEIGGAPALRCLQENRDGLTYWVWVRTESTALEFRLSNNRDEFAVFRWRFDPVLASLKVP